jgi:hypothetical protein
MATVGALDDNAFDIAAAVLAGPTLANASITPSHPGVALPVGTQPADLPPLAD